MTTAQEEAVVGDRRADSNALNVLLVEHLKRMNKLQEQGFHIQKNELRWRNIRFAGWFLLGLAGVGIYALFTMLFYSVANDGPPTEDYASLIRLDGVIASDQKISAQRINPALTRAFRDTKSKGVVLLINSPGGSPVQASLIRDRLLSLRQEYPGKKVVTVAEDMLTSGAYLIATGTEAIYVNRSTVAGSIGVIMSGFGFDGILHRVGVERRLFTAGDHKSFLDPYTPVRKDDVARARAVLDDTHRHFIDAVLESRRSRLKGDRKTLFNGDFWTGEKALALGLVDGIGDLSSVLKTALHVEYTRDYTPVPNLFERLQERLPGVAKQLLLGAADGPTYTLR
jgi:protease-4